jgi:protein-disulfide isomerase
MRRIWAAILVLVFSTAIASAAQFGPSQYAVTDDNGGPITNFDLSPLLLQRLDKLGATVAVGNPTGDVTLYQLYDLNCPFCREAARDVDTLLKADPKLKLVFVPYPVLSVQSVQAGKVEVAVAQLGTPEQFMEFHRRVYAGRGTIDGMRALAVAQELGFDQQKIIAAADADDVTDILKSHAQFGSAAKLIATPSYIVNGVAILGHPGLKALKKVVASVRACGKVAC